MEAICEDLGIPFTADRFVFCNGESRPLLPDRISHASLRLSKKAGLNGLRFHDLRHTHATLMLAQGIHPKIVSERLGHGSIAITLDLYSHVTPSIQEAAALRFDEGLAQPAQARTPVPAK